MLFEHRSKPSSKSCSSKLDRPCPSPLNGGLPLAQIRKTEKNYIALKGHPEDDGEYQSSRQGPEPLLTNDKSNSPDGATECSATPLELFSSIPVLDLPKPRIPISVVDGLHPFVFTPCISESKCTWLRRCTNWKTAFRLQQQKWKTNITIIVAPT